MINVLEMLSKRRMALQQKKNKIQEEANLRIAEIDKEISDLDTSIASVQTVLDTVICPSCKGVGTVTIYDAAGQRDHVRCLACAGTGIKND
jgi:DnaJ-class molecular chaperone